MTKTKPAVILALAALAAGGWLVYRALQTPPCANSLSCRESLQVKIEKDTAGIFNNRPVTVPPIDLATVPPVTRVLGETDPAKDKHIYVNLNDQTLSAYQGDELFMRVLVSTGKWNRTPTGEFRIWTMFRATKMSGGSGNDYYYLPNVPYVMFFSGPGAPAASGFGLHGAYWHNNFGHPMSHGCINMRTIDAEKLYYWAELNVPITIYGQTPG